MNIISKQEAIAQRLTKYFTGKPCKNGHVRERWCHNSVCDGCKAEDAKRRYLANPTKYSEQSKIWAKNNPGKRRAAAKKWRYNNREQRAKYEYTYYVNNKEKIHIKNRNWRKKNSDKVRICNQNYYKKNYIQLRKNNTLWRKNNLAWHNSLTAKRRAVKLQRTMIWSDLEKIKKIYEEAKRLSSLTGEKYVVDHIVPLRGKFVSGLHVHNNLQIITHHENSKKSNRINLEEFNKCIHDIAINQM